MIHTPPPSSKLPTTILVFAYLAVHASALSADATSCSAGAAASSECKANDDDSSMLQIQHEDGISRQGSAPKEAVARQQVREDAVGHARSSSDQQSRRLDVCPCWLAPPLQPYKNPPERQSPVKLVVGTTKLCDMGFSTRASLLGKPQCWYTRAYGTWGSGEGDLEPAIPGPTIRIKPGENLSIEVPQLAAASELQLHGHERSRQHSTRRNQWVLLRQLDKSAHPRSPCDSTKRW